MMRNIIYIFAVFFILTGFSSVYSQRNPTPNAPGPQHIFESRLFIADPVIFYNKNNSDSRLDLYISIPYHSLQFAKDEGTGDNYSANIQYDINIKNASDSVVISEFKEMKITEKYDSKVLKRASKILVNNYFLPAGKYIINITLTDNGTLKVYSSQYNVEVLNNSGKEIYSSDLLLLKDYSKNSDGKASITPMINNDVGRSKFYYIFYEVYNSSSDEINREISYEFKSNDNLISSKKQTYTLQPGTNVIAEKFSSIKFEEESFVLVVKDNSGKVLTSKFLINRPLIIEPQTRIFPPQF